MNKIYIRIFIGFLLIAGCSRKRVISENEQPYSPSTATAILAPSPTTLLASIDDISMGAEGAIWIVQRNGGVNLLDVETNTYQPVINSDLNCLLFFPENQNSFCRNSEGSFLLVDITTREQTLISLPSIIWMNKGINSNSIFFEYKNTDTSLFELAIYDFSSQQITTLFTTSIPLSDRNWHALPSISLNSQVVVSRFDPDAGKHQLYEITQGDELSYEKVVELDDYYVGDIAWSKMGDSLILSVAVPTANHYFFFTPKI